ncbi:MAG TPA: hypothetical protein VFC56_07750 [Stellaceae bacterium]|nr:hypothetical protein [Stellaceae bacterium]
MSQAELVERAFRKLTLRPRPDGSDPEFWRMCAIQGVLIMAGTKMPKVMPEAYRWLGETETRRELKKIGTAAAKLADAIEPMHATTIVALANCGVMRSALPSPVALRAVAAACAAATPPMIDPALTKKGRPGNARETGLATVLRHNFEDLTGKKANQAYPNERGSGFEPFAREVLIAIGIHSTRAKTAINAALSD